MVQPCSLASTGQRLIPSKKGGALKIKGGQRMKMHIQNIRRRSAIIRHECKHAPTSSCQGWRAAMVALIAKHKHLMSKWTRRGGGNAHKQTRFFSPQRSCYGTHLLVLLSLKRVFIFRRGRIYCRIPSYDAGGSAGANAMPARDALHCCSQCIALASKMAVDMPTKMFGTTNWQHLIHWKY